MFYGTGTLYKIPTPRTVVSCCDMATPIPHRVGDTAGQRQWVQRWPVAFRAKISPFWPFPGKGTWTIGLHSFPPFIPPIH